MVTSTENTAAHNLHTILSQVRDSGGRTYAAAWAEALDAPWESLEFSRRHSEVTNLLLLTMRQIGAMPDRARSRTERYIPGWWAAVMQPLTNWQDNGRPPATLINQDRLDHLEAAAELISARLGGTDAAPRGGDLSQLSGQCREWLEILGSLDDVEITPALRAQLISQIQHLIWLIDHADLFGGARVAQEASSVIGSLAQASSTLTTQPENTSRWKKGFVAFVTACAIFNQAATTVQDSLEVGTGLVKEIASTVEEIRGE
ncbi:hypothetical protein AB0942_25265 [Streptomyces nodosus]|uniref:hypothetical protein n=1 Tax=Streptomyces nodosus TaxID=40318 RepID=UPI00345716C9